MGLRLALVEGIHWVDEWWEWECMIGDSLLNFFSLS